MKGEIFGIMIRYKNQKMTNKNKHKNVIFNGILYAVASVSAVMLIIGVAGGFSKLDLGKGSILSLFNKIGLTDFDEGRPDLGIEYMYLKKTANPTAEFPYYKYSTNIVVRNYGEFLENGSVVISAGEGQKTAFVRNNLEGLTIDKGQTFIFDDYEVLMDARYNYGQFEFKIDLKDQKEGDDDNNQHVVSVYEEPVKIESLSLEDRVSEEAVLNYGFMKGYEEALEEIDLEVCIAENFEFAPEVTLKYAEVDLGDDVYSYYKVKAEPELFLDEEFECQDAEAGDGIGGVDSMLESLDEDDEYTVFLRAADQDSDKPENFFAVSNLIHMPVQNFMIKAEFTKLFMDYAGIDVSAEGQSYFDDVDEDAWYLPYVKTMFNYGLLHDPMDFTFGPEEVVYRAEVLEPLLNYFDIDLVVDEGAPHFYDVPRDSEDFFFAEALYSSGKMKALGIYLHPEKRMSRQFLNYIIDEFLEEKN